MRENCSVAKVLPEAVDKPENESKELWGVNYDLIIPVLVKALQEQMQEIENLKDMNRQLHSEVETLKAQVENLKKTSPKRITSQ